MGKYLTILKLSLIESLAYRAETLLWVVLDIFPTLVTLLVWLAVSKGTGMIGSLSISQLILYYIAGLLIFDIASTHFEEDWVDEVKYGRIDFLFTKPMHFLAYIITKQLGGTIIGFTLFVLPFSALVLFLIRTGIVVFPTVSPLVIFVFGIFLILSFFINAFFSSLIVLAAFWFDEARSFSHGKWMLEQMFGGALAPLALYPLWIQHIARYLPFQRMFSTPATLIASQKLTVVVWQELGVLAIFAISLYVVLILAWKKTVYKYSSAGG